MAFFTTRIASSNRVCPIGTSTTQQPLEIVLINTAAGDAYGRPDYLDRGCGLGREATLWLLERDVRVVGTDAWSWYAPYSFTRKRFAEPAILRLFGKDTRGAGDWLLPDGKAGQPAPAAARWLSGELFPLQDQRRVGSLHSAVALFEDGVNGA